jgi:hypothetical protein
MDRAAWQAFGERHHTLGEATGAMVACGAALVEVVTQDEYTHDVVFAAGPYWIVYDTT